MLVLDRWFLCLPLEVLLFTSLKDIVSKYVSYDMILSDILFSLYPKLECDYFFLFVSDKSFFLSAITFRLLHRCKRRLKSFPVILTFHRSWFACFTMLPCMYVCFPCDMAALQYMRNLWKKMIIVLVLRQYIYPSNLNFSQTFLGNCLFIGDCVFGRESIDLSGWNIFSHY